MIDVSNDRKIADKVHTPLQKNPDGAPGGFNKGEKKEERTERPSLL
jgi:hypothetical protein